MATLKTNEGFLGDIWRSVATIFSTQNGIIYMDKEKMHKEGFKINIPLYTLQNVFEATEGFYSKYSKKNVGVLLYLNQELMFPERAIIILGKDGCNYGIALNSIFETLTKESWKRGNEPSKDSQMVYFIHNHIYFPKVIPIENSGEASKSGNTYAGSSTDTFVDNELAGFVLPSEADFTLASMHDKRIDAFYIVNSYGCTRINVKTLVRNELLKNKVFTIYNAVTGQKDNFTPDEIISLKNGKRVQIVNMDFPAFQLLSESFGFMSTIFDWVKTKIYGKEEVIRQHTEHLLNAGEAVWKEELLKAAHAIGMTPEELTAGAIGGGEIKNESILTLDEGIWSIIKSGTFDKNGLYQKIITEVISYIRRVGTEEDIKKANSVLNRMKAEIYEIHKSGYKDDGIGYNSKQYSNQSKLKGSFQKASNELHLLRKEIENRKFKKNESSDSIKLYIPEDDSESANAMAHAAGRGIGYAVYLLAVIIFIIGSGTILASSLVFPLKALLCFVWGILVLKR